MGHSDTELSVQFAEKMHNAQTYLRAEMDRLGLFERDGWKIVQQTRERRGGTEMVLRPLHLTLLAPEGLECIVWVSVAEPVVDSECMSPTDGAEARLAGAMPR